MTTNGGLKVLALGDSIDSGMLGGYARAFEALGHSVRRWHVADAINRHVRGGHLGRRVARYMPVEVWVNKANRDLVVEAITERPDLVLVPGQAHVRAGALAQIKVSVPGAKLVLLWPDPLQNLATHVLECLPLYDLVGSYSSEAMGILRRLGAGNVEFLPFGADPVAFPPGAVPSAEERRRLGCDVSFLGTYRPEREDDVAALARAGLSVKVWGPDWERFTRDRRVVGPCLQGSVLLGADLVRAAKCSGVTLNRIDDTNFPAANMRFFEALACDVPVLNSSCPEMEQTFPDGVLTFYYRGKNELVERIRELLADRDRLARVSHAGHVAALAAHTYEHRASTLLRALERVEV